MGKLNLAHLAMDTKNSQEEAFSAAIEASRKVGLDLLKPSSRDLEAGGSLHEDALVVEPYALGVYAPQDWDRLRTNREAGATAVELTDLAEEQGMLGHLRDATSRALYRMAWEAAGVNCIFQGAGEEGNNPQRLIKRLARYTHLIDGMPDFLDRVRTVDDIDETKRQGRRSLALGLNGVPLPGAQVSIEEELGYLRVFVQLGVRIMHLTYNRRNSIGDGCGETSDAGLSAFGHDVVAEMNKLGIIVDLAHCGWKTCIDAAWASTQPVVISHSAAWALHHHIRGKPDDVIRAVVETGGVIGVTNVPAFLGGAGNLVSLLDHIDYLVRKFGINAVAIGTDKVCSIPSAVKPDPGVRLKRRAAWEGLWPSGFPSHDAAWNKPEQLQSMVWTNWPLFTVGLVQRGYSEDEIRKIIGGNILRVARAVWKFPAALV